MTAIPQKRKDLKWKRLFVLPTLVAGLTGFLVSYLITPQYTSRSLISVPPPVGDVWGPVNITEYQNQLTTLQYQALNSDRVLPLIGSSAKSSNTEGMFEAIRKNTHLRPVVPEGSSVRITGIELSYHDSDPERTGRLCNELTSLVLEEVNAKRRQNLVNTTIFLGHQVRQAKQRMDNIHADLQRLNAHARSTQERANARELDRKYRQARAVYADLVSKKSTSEMFIGGDMDEPQRVLLPCSIPAKLDFPNRVWCGAAGLATGFPAGIILIGIRRLS